jgi:hypothetical protein
MIVKLLIQYLYEAEYEPRLELVTTHVITTGPTVNDRFHYKFPHTCKDGCPSPDYRVCQHHLCQSQTCQEACIDFVCEKCCPNYISGSPTEGDASQLLLHSKMYEIGDKYDVTGLKELARDKFCRACTMYWHSKHFAPAAHHAFSTTMDEDTGLREVVIQVISDHINLLNQAEVMTVLHKFNGLAVGLLQKRANDLGWNMIKNDKNKDQR